MENNSQSDTQYIPYKEIAKKRATEYQHKNKEKIKQKNKIKYDLLTSEEKKKRQEYHKDWFNKKCIEKQQELREKARQYNKNRHHNLMVPVN